MQATKSITEALERDRQRAAANAAKAVVDTHRGKPTGRGGVSIRRLIKDRFGGGRTSSSSDADDGEDHHARDAAGALDDTKSFHGAAVLVVNANRLGGGQAKRRRKRDEEPALEGEEKQVIEKVLGQRLLMKRSCDLLAQFHEHLFSASSSYSGLGMVPTSSSMQTTPPASATSVLSLAARAIHQAKVSAIRECWRTVVEAKNEEIESWKTRHNRMRQQFHDARGHWLKEVTMLRDQRHARDDPTAQLGDEGKLGEGDRFDVALLEPTGLLTEEELAFAVQVVNEKLKMIFDKNPKTQQMFNMDQFERWRKEVNDKQLDNLRKELQRRKDQIQSLTDARSALLILDMEKEQQNREEMQTMIDDLKARVVELEAHLRSERASASSMMKEYEEFASKARKNEKEVKRLAALLAEREENCEAAEKSADRYMKDWLYSQDRIADLLAEIGALKRAAHKDHDHSQNDSESDDDVGPRMVVTATVKEASLAKTDAIVRELLEDTKDVDESTVLRRRVRALEEERADLRNRLRDKTYRWAQTSARATVVTAVDLLTRRRKDEGAAWPSARMEKRRSSFGSDDDDASSKPVKASFTSAVPEATLRRRRKSVEELQDHLDKVAADLESSSCRLSGMLKAGPRRRSLDGTPGSQANAQVLDTSARPAEASPRETAAAPPPTGAAVASAADIGGIGGDAAAMTTSLVGKAESEDGFSLGGDNEQGEPMGQAHSEALWARDLAEEEEHIHQLANEHVQTQVLLLRARLVEVSSSNDPKAEDPEGLYGGEYGCSGCAILRAELRRTREGVRHCVDLLDAMGAEGGDEALESATAEVASPSPAPSKPSPTLRRLAPASPLLQETTQNRPGSKPPPPRVPPLSPEKPVPKAKAPVPPEKHAAKATLLELGSSPGSAVAPGKVAARPKDGGGVGGAPHASGNPAVSARGSRPGAAYLAAAQLPPQKPSSAVPGPRGRRIDALQVAADAAPTRGSRRHVSRQTPGTGGGFTLPSLGR